MGISDIHFRVFMIPALDPYPESDSEFGFGSSKKENCNTSNAAKPAVVTRSRDPKLERAFGQIALIDRR